MSSHCISNEIQSLQRGLQVLCNLDPASFSSLRHIAPCPAHWAPASALDSLSLNLESSSFFFYRLAPECIRDLVVSCIVMSLIPITMPGVREDSWSKRMKEFILTTKTQLMCKSYSSSGYMVYNYKMKTLYEHLKTQCLFCSLCYIMLTSAAT